MKTNRGFGFIAIIIIAAIVLAAGGGTYYAVKTHSSAKVATDTTMSASSTTTADVSTSASASSNTLGSLKDILGIGKNVVCTISESTATSSVSGTVYISGTNMSGQFTTVDSSGTHSANMIRNNDDVYAWTGTQGAKILLSAMENVSTQNTQTRMRSSVDLNQNVHYSCTPWTVDQTKFTVPTTVKFIDVQAMMNTHAGAAVPGVTGSASGSVTGSVTGSTANCSVCNKVPAGPGRDQSTAMMHC